jgi:hypothetical protein
MIMIRSHTGGCQCGAVRFRTEGEPKFIAHCHCASCRRATGGEYATWVGWGDEQVDWGDHERQGYASSTGVQRGFCGQCGTPLSYQGEMWPGETHLLIGLFDAPQDFPPRGDAFKEEALPWIASGFGDPR